jgi:hypothetical protein
MLKSSFTRSLRRAKMLGVSLSLFCLAALPLSAASVQLDRTADSVAALQEHHLLTDAEYWQQNAVAGGKCDGTKVAKLLIEMAKIFKESPATTEEAIQVLLKHGVVSAPDAWRKGSAGGATMNGANVATVLTRCAAQLPMEPPKSASAAPLEPTPAAKIKGAYDVIIAGAGTGGVGAAVQAARMGRSVLLLEETDWIGGQMNSAAVTSMDEGGTLVRERGIYRELVGLIAAHYQPLGISYLTAYWNSHVCVEPRVGKKLLHVLLGDARGKGVLDLALRSRVTKVTRNGDTVTGVEVESVTDSGKETHTVASKILVDATEWGDVIPLTGARYRVGNCTSDAIDRSRHVQDNTWTAVVKQYPKGVPDELQIKQAPPGYTDKVEAAFARAIVDGDKIDVQGKPWTWATFIGYRGMPDSSRPGTSPPITRTHLNYSNDYHSSVAEIEDRDVREATNRQMRLKTLHLLYFIQHTLGKTDWSVANDEGYDSRYNRAEIDRWLAEQPDLAPYRAVLYHFSVMPYTRESRRIIGVHTLVAHEVERKPGHPVQFAHSVAIGDYPVDMHGSMTPQYLELDLDHESDIPHGKFGDRGAGPFSIPFECFIPEKIDGFLPAEKNLSQSRMVNGATRLQPHTMLMGQAVGAITALSIEHQVQPRALDPALVQKALLETGDTLCIDGAPGTHWNTQAWRDKQTVELKNGAPVGSAKP